MDCTPTPTDNKTSRKRKADPENWKRNVAKKQRYSAKSLPNRPSCQHKKSFECRSLTMNDIKHFHYSFYEHKNRVKQDAFLLKHCSTRKVKRRRRSNIPKYSEQRFQTKYFVYSTSQNKKVPTCQNFFLSVLQIKKYRVQSVMKEYFNSGKLLKENRGGDRISHRYLPKQEAIKSFINKLSCQEPHYCRGKSKRYYLPSELSINKLYKMYNAQASSDLTVKQSYFRLVFNTKYNLAFGSPRTDVCATCLRNSEILKRESNTQVRTDLMIAQRLHKLKYKAFYQFVKEEKSGLKTFSFDCQKNLNLLKVPDQIAYYLRNVYLYNFTIVEGSSKSHLGPENVFSYCWTENLYPKAANEIASAVYHRLQNSDLSSISTVRLIADGCAGQNKNSILLSMVSKWLTEAPQNIKCIEIIFPVVGHSYIPPDRVFANIEKEVRNREVISNPQQYLDIISKFSTVVKLGTDCKVFDWKTAAKDITKPVGNWHFKFKLCKRYTLKRSKRAGNVLIQGDLHYRSNDGKLKNVNKSGKLSSMIMPTEIFASNNISAAKTKDVLSLLKSHWGSNWKQYEELNFYISLLEEQGNEQVEEDEELCESQEEIEDFAL